MHASQLSRVIEIVEETLGKESLLCHAYDIDVEITEWNE